ncbi:MAG: D-cysteine desulfhydrase family protein [Porticoccus sp.]
MINFPEKLSLAQTPTPLQPLDRLSDELGGPRIWVKRDDMTGCAISGNKVRKLEFVLAKALAEGADTLITCGGIQSNHCRATAILGAQLGLKVHLILRGNPPVELDGNLLLDYLTAAEVSYYPLSEYQHLDKLFDQWQQHYRHQGRHPFSIPTGASNGTGAWGYINCARELADDFRHHQISPSAIVAATGSGGTQAGLTLGAHLFQLNTSVLGIAVCDDADYFFHKVRKDMRDWQQHSSITLDVENIEIHVNDQHIGPGYAKATPEIFSTIRHLAALEGIILDPVYSGKAFHGLLQEIRAGQFHDASDIVFIHTGGLFGLFAQRSQLGLS